jgi:hypothetical protein
MSLSKLESLPNEILTDIIEKYINGVDVLKALSYQLNRRFVRLFLNANGFISILFNVTKMIFVCAWIFYQPISTKDRRIGYI